MATRAPRDKTVQVRLSAHEKRALVSLARADGLSASAWVRRAVRHEKAMHALIWKR